MQESITDELINTWQNYLFLIVILVIATNIIFITRQNLLLVKLPKETISESPQIISNSSRRRPKKESFKKSYLSHFLDKIRNLWNWLKNKLTRIKKLIFKPSKFHSFI